MQPLVHLRELPLPAAASLCSPWPGWAPLGLWGSMCASAERAFGLLSPQQRPPARRMAVRALCAAPLSSQVSPCLGR